MALVNKKKIIRDITMMLRKECIQLEPADRVPISGLVAKTKNNEEIRYLVGGVSYNVFDEGVQYFMFNDRGKFIVPENGPRLLDSLPGSTLNELSDKIRLYCDKAMRRASNLSVIRDVLDSLQEQSIYFVPSSGMPEAFVDVERKGDFERVMFESLFRAEDGQVYLSGGNGESVFNYPLNELTDMGVAEIVACMPAPLKKMIEKDNSAKETQEQKRQSSTRSKGVSSVKM